jgi:N-acetylneuraminic acid mutarotase
MRRYAIATLVLPALALFVPAAWAAETWNTMEPMTKGRCEAVAAELNGKIYVMAGYDSSYLKNNEMFDPSDGATGSWVDKKEVWTARRSPAIGVVNGKIYVIGGINVVSGILDNNEEYDPTGPDGGTWDDTVTDMPTARYSAAYATLNNKIYVIGGYNGSTLDTCQAYDPLDGSNGSWETLTPMPTAREGATASVVNGKIYVIGGHDGSSDSKICEAYDPATDTWDDTLADMSTARKFATSGAVNGMIYVMGGTSSSTTYHSINEEYNVATNTWTTRTPLPEARIAPTSSVVNGKLYVIGGEETYPDYDKTCWEYTPPVTNIPPSITTQPESVTVGAGETAVFTVAADGTPAPTYQWQKSTDGGGNWTDISGETGTTYTTPATVPADDGTRFRCIATNIAGDAVSQAAVLSIRTTVTIPLDAGYTLVALPVEPEVPLTSETLAQSINADGGSCTAVIRYIDNAYETHPTGSSQAIFPIELGRGYFVRCTAACVWTITEK